QFLRPVEAKRDDQPAHASGDKSGIPHCQHSKPQQRIGQLGFGSKFHFEPDGGTALSVQFLADHRHPPMSLPASSALDPVRNPIAHPRLAQRGFEALEAGWQQATFRRVRPRPNHQHDPRHRQATHRGSPSGEALAAMSVWKTPNSWPSISSPTATGGRPKRSARRTRKPTLRPPLARRSTPRPTGAAPERAGENNASPQLP